MKCMLAGDCIETPAFAAKKKRKTKIRSEENKENPDAFFKKLREGQAKRLLELNNTNYNNRIPERKHTQRAILMKRYKIHQSVSRLYPLEPIFLENACDRDDARILRQMRVPTAHIENAFGRESTLTPPSTEQPSSEKKQKSEKRGPPGPNLYL